jgi:hypothetical protein
MLSIRSLFAILVPFTLALAGCPTTEEPADDDDSAMSDGRVQVVGTGFFETIQEALDAAPEGGTVLLGSGCYDESFEITKPVSITGDSPTTTVISGGGLGSAITVTGVTAGPVTLNSFLVRVPRDEPATLRALRVVDSTDVLVHDTNMGFETGLAEGADDDFCERVYLPDQNTGDCDAGLLGIDVSQSTLLVSDTTLSCMGFNSQTGGTGILAQTNAELTVTNSRIEAVGSFGIRTVDSTLTVNDLSIFGVNRDPSAQDFESNGSAIFVESSTAEVLVDGLTVENGVFVGLWSESSTVTVSDSSFTGYNYGIYMPGDTASAGGRQLTVHDSVFFDLRNEAILATASATILGSDFRIKTLLPPLAVSSINGGVNIQGAGTVTEISNNTFDGLAWRAIGIYGSGVDGNAESVLLEGNTITNVVAGNGIDVQRVDDAEIRGNVVDGVDHAYNNNPNSPGSISSGFGIDCFNVDDCQLEGNTVIGAEFGNYVIVGSSFDSVDDTSSEGSSRGFHIETSQGTFTNPTIVDQLGYGLLAVDSTIQGDGGTIADTLRGPSIQDIDGNADPLPGELLYIQGGVSLWMASQGAPTFLLWENGLFADSASSAVTTQDSQVQLVNNQFLGAGFTDENGYFPSSAIYLQGNDPQALTGPIFANNVVDGGEGSWGVYVAEGRDMTFTGNTICAGSSTGLYLRESGGSVVEDNRIGNTDDPDVAFCDSLEWVRGIYVSQTDPEFSSEGVTLRDLEISAPIMDYGIYFNGLAAHTIDNVTITDALDAGIYGTMSLPTGLTSDVDLDGRRPYEGDCDDTNPNIGALNQVDIPGDGLDNDCDGVADDGIGTADLDGDGFTAETGECNDLDPTVNPDALEIVNNFRDDNCDGWADFDGEYDWLEIDISGTTISGAEDALWLSGATMRLLDPVDDAPANSITDVELVGAYVGSWQWSSTPLYRPGSIEIGADTVFGPTGSHCISMVATDTTATLTGTTLDSCGGHGVNLSGAGNVVLDEVTIVSPGESGVMAINGTLDATDLTVTGPGSSAVSLSGFLAQVGITNLEVLGGAVGVSQFSGELAINGYTSDGTAHSALEVFGGNAVLTGVDVLGAGSHGLDVTGGTVALTDSIIGAVDEDGIKVSGAGSVVATNVAVGAVVGTGVRVQGGTLDWTGGSVTGPGEDAVGVTFGTADFEDAVIVGPAASGFAVSGGTLNATGGSVSDAGADGAFASGGSLNLDGVSVSGSVDDGVHLEGSASATVLAGVLADNGAWGLTCDGGVSVPTSSTVSLSACEAEFDGNTDGPFELSNGCELSWDCTDLTP